MTSLGVTGSTGRLGGRIARLLAASGVQQRLLVRDPSRAPVLDGATPAPMSYDDAAAVEAACAGLDVVLMVSASESADRLAGHRSFVDAAARAGVRHLVYVSFYGAAADATFTLARDHHHTEQHVRSSGMAWTFLRDNLYLDFFPQMTGTDDVIRGPAGDGRVAAVAQDDIAAAAHTVLLDPDAHAGATYSLTGPEALSLDDVAAVLSRETGRDVVYHRETLDEAYASRATYGAPDWQVDAWVSTYTAIAAGELAGLTDDVERLTGRRPRSLADLLRGSA
jgi:NAD(P)H dehydrogenase (quinone)